MGAHSFRRLQSTCIEKPLLIFTKGMHVHSQSLFPHSSLQPTRRMPGRSPAPLSQRRPPRGLAVSVNCFSVACNPTP